MVTRNVIQLAYDHWGRDAGLEKHSGSWYQISPEVIAVSNLQKSQYGPRYFFNQGFWLRALGDDKFPKENHCHIRVRLGSLPGFDAEHVDRLLDLDSPGSDQDRSEELKALLTQRLLPLIQRGSTVSGWRTLRDEGGFKAAGVRGAALELLNASI